MDDRETIDGLRITEEQIDAWAAEAEAGCDLQVLKKRRRERGQSSASSPQSTAAPIDERGSFAGRQDAS
jgi:hypothetical protein